MRLRGTAYALALSIVAACSSSSSRTLTACEMLDRNSAVSIAGQRLTRLESDDPSAPTEAELCVYGGNDVDVDGEPLPRVGLWVLRDVYDTPTDFAETISGDVMKGIGRLAIVDGTADPEVGLGVFVDRHLSFHVWGAGGDVSIERLVELARTVAER